MSSASRATPTAPFDAYPTRATPSNQSLATNGPVTAASHRSIRSGNPASAPESSSRILMWHPSSNGDGGGYVPAAPIEAAELPERLPRGSAVILVVRPATPWAAAERAIEDAAGRVINASIALHAEGLAAGRAVRFGVRARLLGVGAFITDWPPSVTELRRDLSDPGDWPAAAVQWVRRRGWALPPVTAALLELLARHAPAHRSLKSLIADHGPPRRQWDAGFTASGLGPPAAWHTVLRVIGFAMAVQRHPDVRLEEMAFRSGLSSASALSDRISDVIGAPPVYIRDHPGTEWMLADALKGVGIL